MNKNMKFSEPEAKEEPQVEAKKFRYVCQGCTKNALFSSNCMVGVIITCPHCGKEQKAESQNYIYEG